MSFPCLTATDLEKSYFWQLLVQNEDAPPFPDCQLSTLTTVKPSLMTAPSFTYWDWDHFARIWKHGIGIILPGLGNILVLAKRNLCLFQLKPMHCNVIWWVWNCNFRNAFTLMMISTIVILPPSLELPSKLYLPWGPLHLVKDKKDNT